MDANKLKISILLKLGKKEDANKMINSLIDTTSDKMSDEILMMNSDIALESGDLKKAVNLLKVGQ